MGQGFTSMNGGIIHQGKKVLSYASNRRCWTFQGMETYLNIVLKHTHQMSQSDLHRYKLHVPPPTPQTAEYVATKVRLAYATLGCAGVTFRFFQEYLPDQHDSPTLLRRTLPRSRAHHQPSMSKSDENAMHQNIHYSSSRIRVLHGSFAPCRSALK